MNNSIIFQLVFVYENKNNPTLWTNLRLNIKFEQAKEHVFNKLNNAKAYHLLYLPS